MARKTQKVPLVPTPSAEEVYREAFKELVKSFFTEPEHLTSLSAYPRTASATKRRHLTIPNLAEHIGWHPKAIISYSSDGPLARILEHAILSCENYLVNGMLNETVDTKIGTALLEQYHGFKRKVDIKSTGTKNISDILNALED